MARNIAPAFGSEQSYDDASESSAADGGLFLTAIHDTTGGHRHEPKQDTNFGSLHEKLISTLNLSQYDIKSYDWNGPLQPGYKFYHIISHTIKLRVPIPDTVVVEGAVIYHLYNDRNGYIKKSAPNMDSRESIEAFVASIMDRFVFKSISVLTGTKHAKEHISQRIVGVVKKPAWRTHITNHCETLTALGVQAHLLHGIEAGNTDSYIIQKFVKSRGRKPTFTRMIWKAHSESGTGAGGRHAVCWNLFCSNNDFTAFPPVKERTDEDGMENFMRKMGRRQSSSAIPEALLTNFNSSERVFLEELRSHMDMTSSDRGVIKLKESQNFKLFGYKNEGELTPQHSAEITATKVVGKAVEGLDLVVDQLVLATEQYARRKHGLSINIVEMICDFIKDEEGKWWMVQVKGTRLSSSNLPAIRQWKKQKAMEDQSFDFDDEDNEKFHHSKEYRKKVSEAMEKQADAMGNLCKLCGVVYPEGAVVERGSSVSILGPAADPQILDVDEHSKPADDLMRGFQEDDNSDDDSTHSSKLKLQRQTHKQTLKLSSKTVSVVSKVSGVDTEPCFGYRVTDRMALSIAATYRDREYPLTKYSRDLLIEESRHSLAGLSKPPVHIVDGTKQLGRQKKLGAIEVCIHCMKIYEEQCHFKSAAGQLYSSLGLGQDISDSKNEDSIAADVYMAGTGEKILDAKSSLARRRLKAANQMTSSGAFSSKRKQHCKQGQEGAAPIETHLHSNGQMLPWTSSFFERSVEHWRIMLLFHGLLDVGVDVSHPLHNAFGCLSYSLGQQVQSVSFRNCTEDSRLKSQGASSVGTGIAGSDVVWIRQCRLHFLFASRKAAAELFATKRLQFHLFLCPDNAALTTTSDDLQWEGTCEVDLHQLNWTSPATASGREKIDILVPLETQTMGTVIAKISIALAMSDLVPTDITDLHFHKEMKCFWPPADYYSTQPLPDAWIAMMSSKDPSSSSKKTDRAHPSEKGKHEGISSGSEGELDYTVLYQQYRQFLKNMFSEQRAQIDGTVDCSALMETVHDFIKNEISEASPEDYKKLIPIWNAINMMLEYDRMPARVSFNFFCSKVFEYVDESRANGDILQALEDDSEGEEEAEAEEEEENEVAVAEVDWEQLRKDRSKNSTRAGNVHWGDKATSLHSPTSARTARLATRLVAVMKAVPSPDSKPKPKPKQLKHQDTFSLKHDIEHLVSERYELTERVPSAVRKNRRLIFCMAIFESVSKEADVMDIAELRQYLVEETDKLEQILKLVSVGMMKLPTISQAFESALTAKFSIIRSVICAHLLHSSEKLRELYNAYDTKGVSIISQIGFIATCEACFRTVSSAQSANELHPAVKQLVLILDSIHPKEKNQPPAIVKISCDVHGLGFFFLADMCCVKCEQDLYSTMQL